MGKRELAKGKTRRHGALGIYAVLGYLLNSNFSGLHGIQDGYQPPEVQNWQTFWAYFKLRRKEGDGKLLCNSNDPSCGSNIQSKAGDAVLKQKMKNKNSINKKHLHTKARRMENKQELEVINYNVRSWGKKKKNTSLPHLQEGHKNILCIFPHQNYVTVYLI